MASSTPIHAPQSDSPSWLRGLARRVVGMFDDSQSNAPQDAAAAPSVEPLAIAVSEAIERLGLSAKVVEVVLVEEGGRAVRFNKRAARIVLDSSHAAVAALCQEPIDPWRLRLLVAAAVGEINCAHKSVTTAEELHALCQLLASSSKAKR